MPLSWNEIRARATSFAAEWKGTQSEDADAKPFWDAFFEVFGVSRRKVTVRWHNLFVDANPFKIDSKL